MEKKRSSLLSAKYFTPGFAAMLGLVLMVYGAARVVKTESFLDRAVQATGKVVAVRQGVLAWSAMITVAFVDISGTERQAEFETGGETTTHKQGDSVDLLYDPNRPLSIFVGDPRLRRYPMAGIFFLLGAGLVFFTVRRFREGTLWS